VCARLHTVQWPDLDASEGDKAWLEHALTHHIAFCAVWLLSKVPYALTFYYYEAIMVVPNLIMSLLSSIGTLMMLSEWWTACARTHTHFRSDPARASHGSDELLLAHK
jgi:hypothetical protein